MAILMRITGKEEIRNARDSETYTLVLQGDVELNYNLSDGEYRFLIVHEKGENLRLKETGIIKNATVTIAYFDINEGNTVQESKFELLAGSDVHVTSYYLSAENRAKEISFVLHNTEGHSTAEIDNSGVCMDNTTFRVDVEGIIDKGAKQAKSHQHSRCLTIGKPKYVMIAPILRIDENDVEAGHGLSTGTIDETILYYMKSRGLSRKESLVLLIHAYLLPNLRQFDEYAGAPEILANLEKRVDRLCWM